MAIPALGDIGSKIHMVLFTELKTQSTTSGRQEAAALQKLQRLIPARYHTTEPAEHHKTKTLRQNQTVFQLGCERVASEVFARRVASQFVTSAVDAIPVERGRAAGSAEIGVIGEDLFVGQAPILSNSDRYDWNVYLLPKPWEKKSDVKVKKVRRADRSG